MRQFNCAQCGKVVYFENHQCLTCGTELAFDPVVMSMVALRGSAAACANKRDYGICNWVRAAGGERCLACAANVMVPDLSQAANLQRWQELEAAKRRLFYSLLDLGLLSAETGTAGYATALRFEFLASTAGTAVTTGHADGLITLDIAEAEDQERTRRREALGEDYRTLLGHLRHEVGHYYWMVLVQDGGQLDAFRTLFGDERADYAASIARHYEQGPRTDWQTDYISAYAMSHPHEDWAETFAHYLHLYDTLTTAAEFGFVPPPGPDGKALLDSWLPFSVRLNLLSRSMGQGDLYPFVITVPVREKLLFVHQLVRAQTPA